VKVKHMQLPAADREPAAVFIQEQEVYARSTQPREQLLREPGLFIGNQRDFTRVLRDVEGASYARGRADPIIRSEKTPRLAPRTSLQASA
jgi:hypothetical protein